MNKNIQIVDTKKTGLFTNYIFKAIPLAFDESLSYYECLCGLLSYLKDTVIPVLNNNAEVIAQLNISVDEFKTYINGKVEELENFVNNYFDNLDVQDEIDHKLDEMVEDGTIERLILNTTKLNRIYETYDEALADDTKPDGLYFETLGYHSVNDGGNAQYKYTNNTITMIYNNEINVKQFGAYGDGIHDDTDAINDAIEYCDSIVSDDRYENSTVSIPKGKYLISDTIVLPIYIKLKPLNNVVFLTTHNGVAIHITANNKTVQNTNIISDYSQSNKMGLIDSTCGNLVLNRYIENDEYHDLNNVTNSIGIKIGDDSYVENALRISRFYLNNVNIYGFTTGIKIMPYNTYLINLEKCYIYYCRTGIEYGVKNSSAQNSGENFMYNECLITGCYNAFISYNGGEHNFVNTSIDYVGNMFYFTVFGVINFTNGHFEGVGGTNEIVQTNAENTDGYGSILFYDNTDRFRATRINFFGTGNYQGNSVQNVPKFKCNKLVENNTYIIVNFFGTEIAPTSSQEYMFYDFLGDQDSNAILINSYNSKLGSLNPYLANNNDIVGHFDNISSISSTDLTAYNYRIFNNNASITDASLNTTTKIYNKSLEVTFTDSTYTGIERTLYNLRNNILNYNVFFKPDYTSSTDVITGFKVRYVTSFYNRQNTLIKTDATVNKYDLITDDTWYRSENITQHIPVDADYVKINVQITPLNASDETVTVAGSMLFGGFVVDLTS